MSKLQIATFTKMHGLGNDFVVLDARREPLELTAHAARMIAHRRIGVGCDQIIVLKQPTMAEADVQMQLFNLDGSQPEACGNGTRCGARLVLDETGADRITFQVINRIIHAWRAMDGRVEVDMGEPGIEWQQIPLSAPMDTLHVPLPVLADGYSGDSVCTNMGNPHATLFVDSLDGFDISGIGSVLELNPVFREKANIGFAQIHSRSHMSFRVWERGSGATLACGSAVCGAVVGAIRRGLMEGPVTVDLELGRLEIDWKPDNHVHMTGPAAYVATGAFSPEFLALL